MPTPKHLLAADDPKAEAEAHLRRMLRLRAVTAVLARRHGRRATAGLVGALDGVATVSTRDAGVRSMKRGTLAVSQGVPWSTEQSAFAGGCQFLGIAVTPEQLFAAEMLEKRGYRFLVHFGVENVESVWQQVLIEESNR